MKKIKNILVVMIMFFICNIKVNAAASLSSNKSTVYVGDSFNVTVNLSGVASWEVHVSSSGPVSGCTINAADATESATNGSKSYSVSCKATSTGSINVNLSGNTTTENDVKSSISGSKTITVVEKSASQKPSTNTQQKPSTNTQQKPTKKEVKKSGDDHLKYLKVEGYELNESFDQSKYEYSVNVPYGIEKVKILAEKNHEKASMSGTVGEVNIHTGDNKYEVTVKAENGDVKVYKLNIIVDSKPIIIKIDNKEYTLIKNKNELPELKTEHEDLTLTIEETEIPAYRIDKINYVLVGLKDSDGNSNLYQFISYKQEEHADEYKLYREIHFGLQTLIYVDFKKEDIPNGYREYIETIDSNEIKIYKENNESEFALIYGYNLDTGIKSIYSFDSVENTIQRFIKKEEVKDINPSKEEKLIIILSITIVVLILLLTISITHKKNVKKEKPKKNTKEKINELEISNDFLSKKEIKKIEKTTKKDNKKNSNNSKKNKES